MVFKNTTLLLLSLVLTLSTLLDSIGEAVIAADINATITTGLFEPQMPVNLAVTVGDASVDLSWSPPVSDGGVAITDYVIEYKLSVSGVWVVYTDGTSTDTFATVTGLANDNSYDFRVYAVNAIGQGPASVTVEATPGSPAQVLITGFPDLTVPSVVSLVRITNEGSDAYEYQYTWCVTISDANLCGGGDDIFSSSAAKLIQSGENWDTSLPVTVQDAGNYWFHIQVAFGSDSSYASQSFTATSQSSSGGGSSGSRRNSNRVNSCVGPDVNRDRMVNLVDFSILLMFFNATAPFTNPCVDINRDSKVNIVDFSIMLTQWGKKPIAYTPAS